MPDDKPPQPESKPTVEMAKVPDWAIELTRSVKEGFKTVAADIALVSTDLGVVKDRLNIVEAWKVDTEARATRTSAGVKGLSTADAEQAAQLAQERMARESLAAKVDALDAKQDLQTQLLAQLVKLTEKPMVKLVATAIGTAILTWLGMKGLR